MTPSIKINPIVTHDDRVNYKRLFGRDLTKEELRRRIEILWDQERKNMELELTEKT